MISLYFIVWGWILNVKEKHWQVTEFIFSLVFCITDQRQSRGDSSPEPSPHQDFSFFCERLRYSRGRKVELCYFTRGGMRVFREDGPGVVMLGKWSEEKL